MPLVTVDYDLTIGKTSISILGIAYVLYNLLCLNDPQTYYGLTPGSKIVIAFFNISLDLSYGVAYASLQNHLQSSQWFREHGEIKGTKNPVYVPGKNIEFAIGSKEQHGLGKNIFCVAGDTNIVTDHGTHRVDELSKYNSLFRVDSLSDGGSVVSSNICTATKVGESSDLIKIILDDDSYIKVTPDHLIMTDHGYVKAKDLNINDEIISVHY